MEMRKSQYKDEAHRKRYVRLPCAPMLSSTPRTTAPSLPCDPSRASPAEETHPQYAELRNNVTQGMRFLDDERVDLIFFG